uniref:B30.2/SPRY domain-containing protein n=1 Tax=Meloidogyne hapla TaxID=6305 RepID=A0A1I8B3V4_MELHA
MVSYMFNCRGCSSENKEKWSIRSTSYSSMAVMALANMTLEYFIKQYGPSNLSSIQGSNPFFSIDQEIIQYMDKNWEYLSTTPKRQKKSWHQTILKTLQKETELFVQDSKSCSFALKEKDLLRIGPMHESILQLFKRGRDAAEREANSLQINEQQIYGSLNLDISTNFSDGPKTRGASKRKAAASNILITNNGGNEGLNGTIPLQKKAKIASEFATVAINGQSGITVDFPFNREGYRYYLVEKDPNIPNRDRFDREEINNTRAVQIPSHIHRIIIPQIVTLSPNDRANQLLLDTDNLTVTGYDGYSSVRATHSVSHGKWYFEMEFLSQPGDSHVRVGWAQPFSPLQACIGYSKFSYSWRSKHGTIFNDGKRIILFIYIFKGYGRSYYQKGFKQGDIIGCLIDLPSLDLTKDNVVKQIKISDILPPSRKECDLIKFKQNYFFEEKEETQQAIQKLQPLTNSKIEFFLNGQNCGVAFQNIFAGHYFPAVSLFHSARVRLNFGPNFRRIPECIRNNNVRPMSERPKQMEIEQVLSDTIHMVVNEEDLNRRNVDFFNAILINDKT